jgi:hypothetical protein
MRTQRALGKTQVFDPTAQERDRNGAAHKSTLQKSQTNSIEGVSLTSFHSAQKTNRAMTTCFCMRNRIQSQQRVRIRAK